MGKRGVKPRPLGERIHEKVEKTDNCWLWTGLVNSHGYGQRGGYDAPETASVFGKRTDVPA